MRDVVIICTKDRSHDLARCLDSIAEQEQIPSRVIVADASIDSRSAEVAEHARGLLEAPVTYMRCAPGLTKQRNQAIEASQEEIVHFIDDDVSLHQGYFKNILKTFDSDTEKEIGGVGGLIVNLPVHQPKWWHRILFLDSRRQGVILPSGRNIQTYACDVPVDVEWLSGCSMSFRRVVFVTHHFDECLGGHALGEDVDLTYRLKQVRRLVVNPDARLEHLTSSANRSAPFHVVKEELIRRYSRVRSGVGHQNRLCFWVSAWGQFVLLLTKSVVRRSRSSARGAYSTLSAIRSIMLGQWRC